MAQTFKLYTKFQNRKLFKFIQKWRKNSKFFNLNIQIHHNCNFRAIIFQKKCENSNHFFEKWRENSNYLNLHIQIHHTLNFPAHFSKNWRYFLKKLGENSNNFLKNDAKFQKNLNHAKLLSKKFTDKLKREEIIKFPSILTKKMFLFQF